MPISPEGRSMPFLRAGIAMAAVTSLTFSITAVEAQGPPDRREANTYDLSETSGPVSMINLERCGVVVLNPLEPCDLVSDPDYLQQQAEFEIEVARIEAENARAEQAARDAAAKAAEEAREAEAEKRRRATATSTASSSQSTDVNTEVDWDRLAQCESEGRWNANTGNGFYGGLQFMQSTWKSNGGLAFAERADLATPQQQKTVASWLHAKSGLSPWPHCGKRL